jgi:hypothetical protein
MTRERTADGKRREALRLKNDGLTNAEIGERLGVSSKTAFYYLQEARKLPDCETVTECPESLDHGGRYRKARADKEEEMATLARLRREALEGSLIPRKRVLTFLTALQARIGTGSASVKKLADGDAAVALLQEAFKGLNDESAIMLGDDE